MYVFMYNLMYLLFLIGFSIDEFFFLVINFDNFLIGFLNGVDLYDEWFDWDVDLWLF